MSNQHTHNDLPSEGSSSGSSRERFLDRIRCIRQANRESLHRFDLTSSATDSSREPRLPSFTISTHQPSGGAEEFTGESATISGGETMSGAEGPASSSRSENEPHSPRSSYGSSTTGSPRSPGTYEPSLGTTYDRSPTGTYDRSLNTLETYDRNSTMGSTLSPGRSPNSNTSASLSASSSYAGRHSNASSKTQPASPHNQQPDPILGRFSEDNLSKLTPPALTFIEPAASHEADDEHTYGTATDGEDATLDGRPPVTVPLDASTPMLDISSSSSTRHRIPGGAAAKLMLLGPQASMDDTLEVKSSRSHETMVDEENLKEIEITMQMAKEEFEKGPGVHRRLQLKVTSVDDDDDEGDQALSPPGSAMGSTTPSFMNRSEIFHKTAAAAVAALLTPKAVDSNSVRHVVSGGDVPSVFSHQSSVFQAPVGSILSPQEASFQSFGRHDVSESLLKEATERKLEEMAHRMHDPTKTLTDLLTAIATPDDPSQIDLGYMVRRKNACGALKVLTNDARKRVRICWTVGVLPAVTSVLKDSAELGLDVSFPDKRIRSEYEAARLRAIAALQNLVMPKENRIPVFYTPELLQSLLGVIRHDRGTARRGCTAILGYLAKTVDNRLLMTQIPGFFEAVCTVLRPRPPRVQPQEPASPTPSKKTYPWSDGDTSDSDSENEDEEKHKPAQSKSRSTMEDDSERTPRVVSSLSPIELTGYDETADESLRAARQNMFAVLAHLTKEKDNAYHFARDSGLIETLVSITSFHESPSHTHAVKMLAHLTRHRLNTKLLVFQERDVVPALVKAANSSTDETRLYACFALQNFAQDKACRQELAIIDNLVVTLCDRSRYAENDDERLAAISALKNLCDEPANLIPLTNTQGCVATLMHLAHGRDAGVTETMQFRACDALATLSYWLRKIATSGKSLEAVQRGATPDNGLFVPSLRVVTWNQWH